MADRDEEDVVEYSFPGLNKRHGFFHVIERNQLARDSYHWQQEQKKEASRQETRRDKRRERQARRPDQKLYRPPRGGRARVAGLYKLEVEVEPGVWYSLTVEQVGMAAAIATKVATEYGMGQTKKQALLQMIEEYEESL